MMKILALESSAVACSAALCEDGTLIAHSAQKSGLTHSRTLLPLVHSMLANCDRTVEGVDVVAVAVGPGSFTGLRIGVSTAKGLAWAADKRCAPCSTLRSMAWPLAHMEGCVIVCAMDARRGQVYHANFMADGQRPVRLCPDRAVALEEVAGELKNLPNPKIIVGDGAQLCYNFVMEQGIPCRLAPEHLRSQSAVGVAFEALELAGQGCTVTPDALVPVYHRLSQAERERRERESINTVQKG